jgi:uncharacterized protein
VIGGADVVVNLAGAPTAGNPHSKKWATALRESRVQTTATLADAIAASERPAAFLAGNGISYYGDRGADRLPETADSRGHALLTEVTRVWEAATEPARAAGIRVVMTRFGPMLSPAGGVLAKMLPPFRAGLGGPLGSGSQWMSWISIDDAVGAVHHAIMTEALSGPVNATAPQPVTNREFTATLARVLGRPAILPVPAPALRLALGEMGRVAVLGSARVVPERLTEAGYPFRHPALEGALRFVLGRETR